MRSVPSIARTFRRLTVSPASSLAVAHVVRLCGLAFVLLIAVAEALSQQATGETYTAPRTHFDQPDLQGIWQALNTAVWDIEDHSGRLGVPAGQGVVVGGDIPYQPWAAEQRAENLRIA